MKVMLHFVLLFCIVPVYALAAAPVSNKGTEFWYAHIEGSSLLEITGTTRCYLYVYAEQPTTVQVYAPTTGWDTTVVALPGLTVIVLPRDAVNTGMFVVRGYGVHITAAAPVSIVSYIGNGAIDLNGPGHKESTLLLPVLALGYEYYVATNRVNHGFEGRSYTSNLLIVATEDNTEVEITPTDTTVPEYPVGVPFTITLNRGEMFGLSASPYLKDTMKDTTSDLTGSYIRASAPVAVFGGAFSYISILNENSNGGLDYGFEQMAPVSVLGREYILMPVLGTPQPYLCRIFAMYDSTYVTVNGEPPVLLHKGEMLDRENREALSVQSDKPVNVYQYIQNLGPGVYDSLNFSSSAFVAVQPLEQMELREAMFPDVPFHLPYRQTFVNVLMRTEDLTSLIELDGEAINDSFTLVPSRPEYSYARVRMPYGRSEHRITSLKPFIAYVYGSGSNPPHASNASPVYFHSLGGGGRNLLLTAEVDADTVCPDSTISFTGTLQMRFDTAGTLWSWDFGDGSGAEGAAVQHRYREPGIYTVTLTLRKGRFLLVDPVHLTVTVAAPEIRSSSSLVNFGQISPCTATPEQEVLLRNDGNRDAVFLTETWASGTGMFSVVSPSLPVSLSGSAEQPLRIRFRSAGLPGVWRDTLLLAVEPCGDAVQIAVVAEILPGSVSAEPVPLQFGVLSGCQAAQRDTILTVHNTGGQDITLESIVTASPFAVTGLPSPVVVPVGGTHDLAVRFAPVTPGVYAEQLGIAYSYAGCEDTLWTPVAGELRGIPVEITTAGDTTICAGGSAALWAEGGVQYRWEPTDGLDDPASVTPVARPQQTTLYTVTVTNESGCSGSSVVLVQVREPLKLQATGGRICREESVPLSVSGADRYEWSPATGLDDVTSATPVAGPQQTTVYRVTGWRDGCSTTAEVTVEVLSAPVLTVQPDTSICRGEYIRLTTDVQGVEPVSYRWSPAAGLDDATSPSPLASPQQTTLYTLEVVDGNGCRSTGGVRVEVREPSQLSVRVPDVVAAGERFVLPVVVRATPSQLPVADVQLRLVLEYPSRMLLVEGVDGAVVEEDRRVRDDVHRLVLQTERRTLYMMEEEIAVVHVRALLTAQHQGEVVPVWVEVLRGDCVEIDSSARGLLTVDGYCQAHDYRHFEPLQVRVSPQPANGEASIEVQTSVAGEYRGTLYDNYGRIVWESVWEQSADNVHVETVPTAQRGSGLYMLRVEGVHQSVVRPLLIVR